MDSSQVTKNVIKNNTHVRPKIFIIRGCSPIIINTYPKKK